MLSCNSRRNDAFSDFYNSFYVLIGHHVVTGSSDNSGFCKYATRGPGTCRINIDLPRIEYSVFFSSNGWMTEFIFCDVLDYVTFQKLHLRWLECVRRRAASTLQ